MLTLLQYLFGFTFFWEFGLYAYDCDQPQTLMFDTWDIQEVRLTIMLLSAVVILICELWKGMEA